MQRGQTAFDAHTPDHPWPKPTLINAAWAATRKKDCYLRAQFLCIKRRRGAKKAILAVASSMLTAEAHGVKRDRSHSA